MRHLVDRILDGDQDPAGVALRQSGRRGELSYARLRARVRGTASGLARAGMRPGDRVLFSIRPRPEGIVLALAVVRLGGAIVFVDPGSTPELFAARVAAARPRWAATESLLYALGRGPLRPVARRRGVLLPDYGRLPVRHLHAGPRLPGVPWRSRRIARLGRDLRSAPLPPPTDGAALVVFTSGTTAAPRAVVHTTESLAGAAGLFEGVLALKAGQVVHTDQMLLGLPALLAGATWSLPRVEPARDIVAFATERSDATYLVPADVTALLDAVEEGSLVRGPATVLVGGAPVTPALLRRATRLLPGTRWIAVYGATEILPVAAVDAAEKLAAEARGDLVGAPLPGIAARVEPVRADSGAKGCPGELVVSGPSLMAGYLADLDEGERPVTEHRTGDLAFLDDAGRIVLAGRTRDMIIRGTVNVYPGLYEPRIAALPGVGQAVLVGVACSDGDERIALVVTPDEPADGPRAPTTGTSLARAVAAAVPRIVDHGALPDVVVEVAAVPLAGRSRKPDRAALAEQVRELVPCASR